MNNVEAIRLSTQNQTASDAVRFRVRTARKIPQLGEPGFAEAWAHSDVAHVLNFHPQSSDHRPKTQARCLVQARSLHVWFNVQDRFVKCVHTGYQSRVSQDSCVEFFVRPANAKGYFNFEVNCGGTMLLYYITDPARPVEREGGADTGKAHGTAVRLFKDYEEVPARLGSLVRIEHSLPSVVDPEITTDTEWNVVLTIPFEVMEPYTGPLLADVGSSWSANFFKCGDATSHPHWASWSDIGETLRFHQPDRFGWFDFV